MVKRKRTSPIPGREREARVLEHLVADDDTAPGRTGAEPRTFSTPGAPIEAASRTKPSASARITQRAGCAIRTRSMRRRTTSRAATGSIMEGLPGSQSPREGDDRRLVERDGGVGHPVARGEILEMAGRGMAGMGCGCGRPHRGAPRARRSKCGGDAHPLSAPALFPHADRLRQAVLLGVRITNSTEVSRSA